VTKAQDNDAFIRVSQEWLGVPIDGWAGIQTMSRFLEKTGHNGLKVDQSPIVIPDDYWPMLAQIESGNRPYVKARTSSASGLYQFVKSTWIAEGGKWGGNPSQAFGGLYPTPEEQLERAKTFTMKNAQAIQKAGLAVNKATLYAAHFFGSTVAIRVIKADVSEWADKLAGPAATAANPSILDDKTVGQFLTWLKNKTGEWAR
jgi:hypothetical protein